MTYSDGHIVGVQRDLTDSRNLCLQSDRVLKEIVWVLPWPNLVDQYLHLFSLSCSSFMWFRVSDPYHIPSL